MLTLISKFQTGVFTMKSFECASVIYVLLLFEVYAAQEICECLIFSFVGSYGIS